MLIWLYSISRMEEQVQAHEFWPGSVNRPDLPLFYLHLPKQYTLLTFPCQIGISKALGIWWFVFLKNIYLFDFMCVSVLPGCMYVYHMYELQYTWSSEESVKSPMSVFMDDCEPPCVCWELTLCPLQEQYIFLTAEPSPQSWIVFSWLTDQAFSFVFIR